MEREIKNKIIVVTGGADGIGFQIIRSFLKAEAKLAIILDINDGKGSEAVKALESQFGPNKVVYMKCDVVDDLEEISQKICNEFGIIDVLINNAGLGDETVAEKCININLTATVKWSLKFMELMRQDVKGHGGTIINIASVFGYHPAYFAPVYTATKFGVVGFTKALGHEERYSKQKVRVIAICPGFTKTAMSERFLDVASEEIADIVKSYLWQSSEEVGDKAVEVFKIADSGTLWEIEGCVLKEVK